MKRKPFFFGPNESLCPKCEGVGSPASTATTVNYRCSYCLGEGKVRCRPNESVNLMEIAI